MQKSMLLVTKRTVSFSASSPLTDRGVRNSQCKIRCECADTNEGGTALIRPSVPMHRRVFYIITCMRWIVIFECYLQYLFDKFEKA